MSKIKQVFLAYIAYPSPWYVYVAAIGWTAWVLFMLGYICYTFIYPTLMAAPVK
jgi:hypothetical protein